MRNISKFMGSESAGKSKVSLEIQHSDVYSIDGSAMPTYQLLLTEFSKRLQFPEYFGQNMNALYDCLADLSWLESSKIVVFIRKAELVLSDEDNVNGAELLVELFTDAIEHSSKESRKYGSNLMELHLVLHFSSKIKFQRLGAVPQL